MVVLVMALVLTIGSAAFLGLTSSDLSMSRHEAEATRAFYVAQAGIDKAVAQLKVLYSKGKGHSPEELAAIAAPAYDGFTFDEFSIAPEGEPYFGELECGTYRGLHGRIEKIKITSAVSSRHYDNVRVRISQEVEAQFIAVFQFAIFYNSLDLEILPGKPMTILGPVHCNKDSIVTSVGDIYHRRKDSDSYMPGRVEIRDGEGVYREMLNGDGTWLDSEHPDWLLGSQERWDGNVASAAHQVNPLRLPLATPERPRALIERGSGEDTTEMK
jgi:hypothetical protein